MDIEPVIKQQFAKVFNQNDWRVFKLMADYYFKSAAIVLKEDIQIDATYKLMARNIQKRLFIGIGGELLLKSLFLKNDFCINEVLDKVKRKDKKINPGKPTKLATIPNQAILDPAKTYSFNNLIVNLSDVMAFSDDKIVKQGLKIAKVFRNKEGHVVVLWHTPDRQNYMDIETAIVAIYKEGFNETLEYKIAFMDGEEAVFAKK